MSPGNFADHFSTIAGAYATFRPRYPDELFRAIASLCPQRDLAWDCATGTGQAAIGLAPYFERVVATDASAEQVEQAEPHPRVGYAVAPAHRSGLAAGSAALVTVAQALHWLDLQTFYSEVRRVLLPGGMFAAWTYGRHRVDTDSLNSLLERFYVDVIGPYWAPERRLVETGYRTVPFPFEEIEVPPPAMSVSWSLPEMLGYMGTWSAVVRCTSETGTNPMAAFAGEIAPHWGEPSRRRRIEWPLSLRAGRHIKEEV